jgi:hypothetical protein
MTDAIFLIQQDESLVEMTDQPYDSEDLLQSLLAKYPNLIAGNQINPDAPRRWLLVKREAGLASEENGSNRWSVDHLFLDQEGIPTLIEVKRSSDTRIRREVVGQMLDYAANAIVYWPIEQIRSFLESTCQVKELDPDQAVMELIGVENDLEQFWQQVKTNLQAGRIRMIFVADEIPSELRRIVEFLNEQMNPAEVLAVEIKQFAGKGLKTLVPRVMGLTAEAQQKKSTGRDRQQRKWDEQSFFSALLERTDKETVVVVRKLYEWVQQNATYSWWGEGQRSGSFVPVFEVNGDRHYLFSAWTNGSLEMYFYWMQGQPPFDQREKRLQLLRRLNDVPGVNLSENSLERRPNFPFTVLKNPVAYTKLIEAFQYFLDEIKQ